MTTQCEDFPACQHELGCCPDFDPETGKQLNMRCTCGAVVPLTSNYSICRGCLQDNLGDLQDEEEPDDLLDPEDDLLPPHPSEELTYAYDEDWNESDPDPFDD